MRRFALTAMFAATVFSAGCANNQEGGTVLGAVTGGIIGNQFGKGGGKVAATLAGAVVGGISIGMIAGSFRAWLPLLPRSRTMGIGRFPYATKIW